MGAIENEIAKTVARAPADIRALAGKIEDKRPADIASAHAQQDRFTFLVDSLDSLDEARTVFERVLQGNELQPISYLERGAVAARAVARIAIRGPAGSGWGAGFLIAPGVLITNNHVLPDPATAASSLAQFEYELDLADREQGPVSFTLQPQVLFHTSVPLDFTVVAVAPTSDSHGTSLDAYGCLPLLEVTGKVFEGEWLTIVQHPAGQRKQLCVRENRFIKRTDDHLWYSTDTLAGSSGSPVFNNDWFVVALHHSGVPELKNGVKQTLDGRDYDPRTMQDTDIKWVANEGVRVSRIVQTLKTVLPDHPLLAPMYAATPHSARITTNTARPDIAPHTPPEAKTMPDARFPLDIALRIEADGTAHVIGQGGAVEANFGKEKAKARKAPKLTVPFDPDYSTRNGYDADFLGAKARVPLPTLTPALLAEAAPLLSPPKGADPHVLKYWNYSLVMHARRRLAIYSAANVDFGGRFAISRPEDVWRRDPRIKAEHQLENWYYSSNKFDRGHLTRNEDMEYGDTVQAALASAADTCHWANCTPQHSGFNQSKEIWQGIERYILESTIKDLTRKIRAQVITGPVFDEGDPEYRKVPYPVQFWKVVVALDEERPAGDQLVATAYIASQAQVISDQGIEAAPFGAFKTFQTTVAEIERLTGLLFKGADGKPPLREIDPLAKRPPRSPLSPGGGGLESAFAGAPKGYLSLQDLEDIEL